MRGIKPTAANLNGCTFTGSTNKTLVLTGGVTGDCKWSYDLGTSVHTITGSGKMADYAEYVFALWRYSAKSVAIGEGVTYIGNYAFNNCTKLESASFPSTLTTVGTDSFKGLTFQDSNGTAFEPTADKLMGNTFTGAGDGVWRSPILRRVGSTSC